MRKRPSRRQGFTLLEIMLAVTILSLVMAAVYGIWSTSLTSWKRGMAVADSLQRGRVVLDTLEDLARSAEFYPSKPEDYTVISARDANGSAYISFVTTSDALLTPSEVTAFGMRRVALAMSRDEKGNPFLGIVSQPALADEPNIKKVDWRVLSKDVVGFGVRYRNPKDGDWSDNWTETNLVPSAIQFTVAFAPDAPGMEPVVITRAVDLPGATYALEVLLGSVPDTQNTTNKVTLPDINLSETTNQVPTGDTGSQ